MDRLIIIIKPTETCINREKYTFCGIKSLEDLKNYKTDCVPYLGLELTMHVIKSKIHLVRQSLYGCLRYTKSSSNTRKVFNRIWRIRVQLRT